MPVFFTTEPVWIREDTASAIHHQQLAEHGGLKGIRDNDLLQSALARPRQLYHYQGDITLTQLAAAYGFGIARNHPFLDGNKRTALALTDLFLILNGYEIDAAPVEIYQTIMTLAAGDLSEEAFAAWLGRVAALRG